MRGVKVLLAGAASVAIVGAALSGCSSSGDASGASGASGGSSGAAAGSSASPASGSSAGAASTAAATMSGDLKGTVTVNLCDGTGIASIAVHVDGDPSKYLGSASARGLGFVGPEAKDFAQDLGKNPTVPTVSSDLNTITIDGVHAYYELPGSPVEDVVFSGALHCP